MNRNDKPNRSGGGGNATSARTSPSGTCTVGASGPTTLKSLADLLNQEAVTIVETAHGILARHTDTMHLPSVEALLALVPPSSQQSNNKSTSALLLHDATATTAGGAQPSSRQQQQHHRATPIGSLLVASIDALAALLSKLGGSGGVAAALSDGSAASLTKLDVLAALLRVPLLFLLGDRQLPGGGGGGKQHGGGGGGSNRRSVPTAAASSASCAASSSSSQQSYVNMLVGATVALSTVGVFAVTTPRGAQGLSAGSVDHTARTAEQEVRALSLVLVAAIAQGHPDLLSDCLPTLLPDVTSMEGLVNGSSPSNCKYPLLTPLMHDNVYRCRVAASTALTSILQKSQQRLALSAEPGPKDRQSFTSMSTGLGRMLRDVHAVVLCGLMNRETASVRALFLSVASGLVVVTPYNKCPHAQATMLKIIQLPFLADVLSTQKPPSDYSYACTFLGSVWRAKALQPAILGSTATTTPTQTTAPSGRPLGKGGSPSTPLTPAVSSLPPQIMPRLVSLVVAGLPALEALRALTHVARSYPTTYLTPAQTRTIIDLAEGLLVPQSKDENNNNNAATTATMTIQEMLRLLMHLCGLAWEPFQTPSGGGGNNNSSSNGTTCGANSDAPNHSNDHDDDDAIHAATTHPVATATQEQRLRVLRFVYARAVRHTAAAVRMATYKCLGQIGDDVFAQVLLLPTTSTATGAWGSSDDGGSGKGQPQQKTTAPAAAVVAGTKAPSSSSYAYLVDDVIAAATNERDANVRAEALVTLGVWALRYHRSCGSSVERLSTFTDVALDRLQHDVDDEVRAKAVFVLSNVCAQQAGGVAALPSSTDDDGDAARLSHLRLKLCQAVGIAVHVANACRTKRGGFSGGQSVASVVAGHAVRMMQYLLKSLDATSLIMELPGHPEGIVSFFLEQLERYLHSPPVPQQPPFSGGGSVAAAAAAACWDVKTRWNAAYAMGEVLSNPTIYSADPPAARACFDMLMVAVVRDSNFKVRTRAVGAVEKVVAQLKAPRCTPPPPAAAPAPPINVGGGDKKTQHVDCCAASASAETSQQGSEAERYQQAWTMQILAAYRTDWGTRLPSVLSTLCDVLSRLQEEEGAAQYREAGLLHTELMRAVQCVLDAAPGSSDFQDALAKHKRQLAEAGLL